MNQSQYALVVLRVTMGIIFITHGIARLYYESVGDFGNYLNSKGFIIGLPIAWIITIGEIISGSLLALGIKVRYCIIFHSLIIATGLAMVHLPNGWFVVGHGNGGIEYSVLILVVLFVLFTVKQKSASVN
ncbi:MAG: DoxX family protein [Cyclobacteriaceae bacterium]|nr:DoxX family protein [Cyclobacteriaceae bacterium]